jgi:hypothetical protein
VGIPIPLSDDDNQGPFPLGFPFSYYGNIFSELYVCSNGWVSFTSTSTSLSNTTLPSTGDPNNTLSMFWDDLNPGSGGVVYYYADTANDRFIVSYDGVPHYSNTGSLYFQVIINADGSIIFQYNTMDHAGHTVSASIGIENNDGTIGLEYDYNSNPPGIHDQLAILFEMPTLWLSSDVYSGSIAPGGGPDIVEITMDAAELEGGIYTGTVRVLSNDPDESIIDIPVTFTVNATGVDDPAGQLPTEFALHQNYPNPFNPITGIKFDLPKDSHVKLEIFNVLGQKVTTVLDEDMRAGYRSVIWDGTDNNGHEVSSGVYFYKLIAGDHVFAKKMMMLK